MNVNVAFSSEYICDRLAKKAVADFNNGSELKAQQFLNEFIIPLNSKLSMAGRLPRGLAKATCEKICNKLKDESVAVHLQYVNFPKTKLSSSEDHNLSFIMITPTEPEWLGFTSTEVALTRKHMQLDITPVDFRIHTHALARYMNREQKDVNELLRDLYPALMVGPVLAAAVETIDSDEIAIPVKDGCFFGKVVELDKNMVGNRYYVNKNKNDFKNIPRYAVLSQRRLGIEILTYVDWNSLSFKRIELHVRISKFMEAHKPAIKAISDCTFFINSIIDKELADTMLDHMDVAFDAAKELVTSPEWNNFVGRVAVKQEIA